VGVWVEGAWMVGCECMGGGVCLERFGSRFVGVYSMWRDMSVNGGIRVREEG
jgi:hypothetical protein